MSETNKTTLLHDVQAVRARARAEAADAADADLPWVHTPGSVGFTAQGGRASGIASDPEVAQRIVRCVNAHQMLLSALLELKVAAEHRAEFGCYPAGMGARGLTFEAWVASVVDATVDAVALQAATVGEAADVQQGVEPAAGRPAGPLDLPRAA